MTAINRARTPMIPPLIAPAFVSPVPPVRLSLDASPPSGCFDCGGGILMEKVENRFLFEIKKPQYNSFLYSKKG